jgi:hypothetical protein
MGEAFKKKVQNRSIHQDDSFSEAMAAAAASMAADATSAQAQPATSPPSQAKTDGAAGPSPAGAPHPRTVRKRSGFEQMHVNLKAVDKLDRSKVSKTTMQHVDAAVSALNRTGVVNLSQDKMTEAQKQLTMGVGAALNFNMAEAALEQRLANAMAAQPQALWYREQAAVEASALATNAMLIKYANEPHTLVGSKDFDELQAQHEHLNNAMPFDLRGAIASRPSDEASRWDAQQRLPDFNAKAIRYRENGNIAQARLAEARTAEAGNAVKIYDAKVSGADARVIANIEADGQHLAAATEASRQSALAEAIGHDLKAFQGLDADANEALLADIERKAYEQSVIDQFDMFGKFDQWEKANPAPDDGRPKDARSFHAHAGQGVHATSAEYKDYLKNQYKPAADKLQAEQDATVAAAMAKYDDAAAKRQAASAATVAAATATSTDAPDARQTDASAIEIAAMEQGAALKSFARKVAEPAKAQEMPASSGTPAKDQIEQEKRQTATKADVAEAAKSNEQPATSGNQTHDAEFADALRKGREAGDSKAMLDAAAEKWAERPDVKVTRDGDKHLNIESKDGGRIRDRGEPTTVHVPKGAESVESYQLAVQALQQRAEGQIKPRNPDRMTQDQHDALWTACQKEGATAHDSVKPSDECKAQWAAEQNQTLEVVDASTPVQEHTATLEQEVRPAEAEKVTEKPEQAVSDRQVPSYIPAHLQPSVAAMEDYRTAEPDQRDAARDRAADELAKLSPDQSDKVISAYEHRGNGGEDQELRGAEMKARQQVEERAPQQQQDTVAQTPVEPLPDANQQAAIQSMESMSLQQAEEEAAARAEATQDAVEQATLEPQEVAQAETYQPEPALAMKPEFSPEQEAEEEKAQQEREPTTPQVEQTEDHAADFAPELDFPPQDDLGNTDDLLARLDAEDASQEMPGDTEIPEDVLSNAQANADALEAAKNGQTQEQDESLTR